MVIGMQQIINSLIIFSIILFNLNISEASACSQYKVVNTMINRDPFEVLNYFSSIETYNYEKLVNFFGIKFSQSNQISNNSQSYNYLFTPINDNVYLEDINLRGDNDGQMLIINFKKKNCYKKEEFKKRMLDEKFEQNINEPMSYFVKMFNNPRKTVSIGYQVNEDKDICIPRLVFDSF